MRSADFQLEEALRVALDHLNEKNVHVFNPSLDAPAANSRFQTKQTGCLNIKQPVCFV